MIEFFIPGTPQPGGSKKAFLHKHTGRVIIMDDAKRGKDWRSVVAHTASLAYRGDPLDCPLAVRLEFVVMRPKGHYGSGRNASVVKSSSPAFPTVKPDVLKLARSTEDALTGILWRDDCLSVDLELSKRYGPRPGVLVSVRRKTDQPTPERMHNARA